MIQRSKRRRFLATEESSARERDTVPLEILREDPGAALEATCELALPGGDPYQTDQARDIRRVQQRSRTLDDMRRLSDEIKRERITKKSE